MSPVHEINAKGELIHWFKHSGFQQCDIAFSDGRSLTDEEQVYIRRFSRKGEGIWCDVETEVGQIAVFYCGEEFFLDFGPLARRWESLIRSLSSSDEMVGRISRGTVTVFDQLNGFMASNHATSAS